MKKRKFLSSFVALIMFASTIMTTNATTSTAIKVIDNSALHAKTVSAATYASWKDGYNQVLQNFKKSSGYYDPGVVGVNMASTYTVKDLNSDGVPELIINDQPIMAGMCELYTFCNNRVIKLGITGAYLVFDSKENILCWGNKGGTFYYKIIDNKLVSINATTVNTANKEWTSLTNGNLFSKSIYDIIIPETQVTNSKATAEFVTRMYRVVLGRTPDSIGLNKWVSQLNRKQKTAADLINGFFYSDEYKNKKKSANDMIKDCYMAMLNRNPDSKGLADWKKRFDAGMTIQAVCKGFVGSSEFKKLCAEYGVASGTINLMNARDENYDRTCFVYRLYQNCLGRTPDTAGLENWCRNLKNGTTGAQAVKGFFTSKEFTGKKTSNRAFVETVYRTMLGRSGDTSGLNSWVKQLTNGKSRIDIINGFLFSNEFKSQCSKAGIIVGSKI